MRWIRLALVTLAVAAATASAVRDARAASRLYPFAGMVVRFEAQSGEAPKRLTLAQTGAAYSLGRFAPSVVVRAGVGHVEAEMGLRYSFR